jgi:hypothetical protein
MLKTVLVAAVAAFALTGAASAADLIIDEEFVEVDMMAPSSVYDWDGLYAGVSVGVFDESYPYVGGLLGANWTQGTLLFGIEGSFEYYFDSDAFGADVTGRVGVVLDQVVLDVHGGLGIIDGEPIGLVGVGAEIGLTEMISLAGAIDYIASLDSGGDTLRGEASLRFHF